MRFAGPRLFTLLLLLSLAVPGRATNLVITPTTTVAAETGNNTSAAAAFTSQTNGNAGSGNISKVSLRTLLYPGSQTRIYAHFMPWFGGTNHMNVGYRSDDAAQVKRQVDDMISRGIQGVIIDWYGPGNREDRTSLLMKGEAEARGNFELAIMEDLGAIRACAATAGCDVSQQIVSDLTYVFNTYQSSPSYMRIGGRPVVFFFGVDLYPLNWTAIRAGVPGNPLFIFRQASAFTHAQTDGGFSWVGLNTSNVLDMGLGYLANFYNTGIAKPAMQTFGSTYKGFDDSFASWAPTPPRIMSQQCGKVWLSTFAEIGKHYGATSQLATLQLVTWNDYEEGSEIESGIDNCVSVNASQSGGQLSWTLTGDAATVDHFGVFISTDGTNLMPLPDLPAGARSMDLTSLLLDPGSYTFFVKAVGKPTLRNQMSGAVAYTVASPPPPPPPPPPPVVQPPDVTVGALPSSVSVSQGQPANVSVSVAPSGGFSSAVTLSCSNLPAMATCVFSPASLTPGAASASSALLITTAVTSVGTRSDVRGPGHDPVLAFWLGGSPGFAVMGLVFAGDRRRRRRTLWFALALLALLCLAGCGGGAMQTSQTTGGGTVTTSTTPPGTYGITVTATSGSLQRSTIVTLTVQ